MTKRRVVVTGLGMVTPVGLNVEDSWSSVLAGKSGIAKIERFDVSDLPVQICGEIKDFDVTPYMDKKEARRNDTFIQFGVAATKQALDDSGLEITDENAPRIGCAVGSGIGGLPMIEDTYDSTLKGGPRKISPFFIPAVIINMVAGVASIRFNLKGPNISIVTACTTGAHNIGHAMRIIQYGDADVMVAGGAEMATTLLGVGGFSSARALSTRNDEPQKASRPWDKDRDGFVLGEGAGVMILEEYEHAKARGAKIYAELAGFGMSADAYHITSPDPDGVGFNACMEGALNDGSTNPEDVQYINAHGTSTPTGDVIEAKAVEATFAPVKGSIAVSSTKSMTGHMLGATGAVEAIFSVLAIRDNIVPPTINLDNPDEGCNLNFVPHKAQELTVDAAVSNSFGFGGTNGSLLFKKIT